MKSTDFRSSVVDVQKRVEGALAALAELRSKLRLNGRYRKAIRNEVQELTDQLQPIVDSAVEIRAALSSRTSGNPRATEIRRLKTLKPKANKAIREALKLVRAAEKDLGDTRLDFVNRKREFNDLRAGNHGGAFYIWGPAGYGKTQILRRLKEDFESKHTVLYVDLHDEKCQSARNSHEHLLRSFANSLSTRRSDRRRSSGLANKTRSALDEFANNLSTRVRPGREVKVVMIIDSLDEANGDISSWIVKALIPDLQRRRPKIRLAKVYIAGRASYLLQGYGVQDFSLSSFSLKAISEVVDDRKLQDPDGAIAHNLLALTLGHPKSVIDILEEIGEAPAFDRDGRLSSFDVLFKQIVWPNVFKEIIDPASKRSGLSFNELRTIFAYRVLPIHELDSLLFADPDFRGYERGNVVARNDYFFDKIVNGTGLVSHSEVGNRYETNAVVRHAFRLFAWINRDCDINHELHRAGHDVFGNIGHRTEGQAQYLFRIEDLYYSIAMAWFERRLGIPLDANEVRSRLVAQYGAWRQDFKPGDLQEQLYWSKCRQKLGEDPELDLLCKDMGVAGVFGDGVDL